MPKKAILINGLSDPDGKLAFTASTPFISLSLQRIGCTHRPFLSTKQRSGIASRQSPIIHSKTLVRKIS
jgi:hypothetical protein